MPDLGSCWRG